MWISFVKLWSETWILGKEIFNAVRSPPFLCTILFLSHRNTQGKIGKIDSQVQFLQIHMFVETITECSKYDNFVV